MTHQRKKINNIDYVIEIMHTGNLTMFVYTIRSSSLLLLSLSDLCLGVEMKILKEIIHGHYMTHMATSPAPWVMKVTIFGSLFIGHNYYVFSLSDLCLGIE